MAPAAPETASKRDRILAERRARAVQADALVVAIGSHGRRFFWSKTKERFAHFEVNDRGRVIFVDDWTGKPTDTHQNSRWRGFSHGGTLQGLVCAVRDFIVTGTPVNPRYLGPWSANLCGGDLWGYGFDAMEAVRRDAALTGAVGKRPEAKPELGPDAAPKVEMAAAPKADVQAPTPDAEEAEEAPRMRM